MLYINEKSAIMAWKKAIIKLMKAELIKDRKRKFREEEHIVIKIRDPSMKDIEKIHTLLEKKTPWEFPDIEDIKMFLFSKHKPPIFHYTFGERLLNYDAFNQLDNYVISLLLERPKSRRAIVGILNPKKDLKTENMALGSLLMMQFLIKKKNEESLLDIYGFMRSLDIFVGLPFNILTLLLLQEYVANRLGIKTGSINIYSTNAQLYLDYENYIEEILNVL